MSRTGLGHIGGIRVLSTRWVRAFLAGAGDGACIVDPRGRAVRSNRAFQTLLGYSAEELAKTPFSAYTADSDVERNVLLWEDLLSGRRTAYTLGKTYLTKQGDVVERQLAVVRTPAAILSLISSAPLLIGAGASCVVAGGEAGEIVVHRPSPDSAVIELHGEHDLMNSHLLVDALEGEVRANRSIVVDVSKASFIDASVLRAIVVGEATCRKAGIGFALQYGTTRVVHRVLEATGFLNELPCATSREDALAQARIQT